jgi:hypothetical protein
MNPAPSCSVNIDPDSIVFHNFDPALDSSLTVKVLREAKRELEDELSSNKPYTDKHLELCDKKRKLLEHAIEQIVVNSTPIQAPEIRTYPRKEKRIEKALRRKAARIDRLRK